MNPKEITKSCTSDTWESALTGDETLRKVVNSALLKDRKAHSLVNETLMKPLNCVRVEDGKVNSRVKETLKKPVNHAPLTDGKVNSLVDEATKPCTSDTGETELTGE